MFNISKLLQTKVQNYTLIFRKFLTLEQFGSKLACIIILYIPIIFIKKITSAFFRKEFFVKYFLRSFFIVVYVHSPISDLKKCSIAIYVPKRHKIKF